MCVYNPACEIYTYIEILIYAYTCIHKCTLTHIFTVKSSIIHLANTFSITNMCKPVELLNKCEPNPLFLLAQNLSKNGDQQTSKLILSGTEIFAYSKEISINIFLKVLSFNFMYVYFHIYFIFP